ncbi:Homeobox-leucine zipper protein ATHB-14 isoform C, partial [Glycine soja]
ALRHARQIVQESSGDVHYGGGRQPIVLRTFSQRLRKRFGDKLRRFGQAMKLNRTFLKRRVSS